MIAEGLNTTISEICLTKEIVHVLRDVGHIRERGNIVNFDRSSLLFCFKGGHGLLPQILQECVPTQPVGDFFSDMFTEQFYGGLNRTVMIMLNDCFDVVCLDRVWVNDSRRGRRHFYIGACLKGPCGCI